MLQIGQPGRLSRAPHHLEQHQQGFAARQPLQFKSHVPDNTQLPLTGLSPPGRPPGLHVTLRGGPLRILRQPVHRHSVIKGLGQCVHLGQVHGQLGHRFREQALDGPGNPPELGIALAEVVVAVQLVEEEASVDDVVARYGFDRDAVARIERLLMLAEYKRRQAPPGVKLSTRNFGRDRRYPITHGFRTA